MKEALYNMMGEEFKGVQYALSPKTFKYNLSKDGAKMKMNGITLQVARTTGITTADFRADMDEKCQKMTVKNGGILFGKTFIPFGKEGDIGDEVMTNIIQQHNHFLCSTKQRIIQNLNNIDCPIDIVTGSREDLDAATVTLRDSFYQYKGKDGGKLFDAIEKTNTGGTYRFLFRESKKETVDNMLNNLDATLDAFGAWDDCGIHFRYLTALPISVVGRVVKSTPTAFWANQLPAFKANDIPVEIYAQELQYNTKKRVP
jgi:hypothetical protein